jgi:hypothetical protein
MEFFMGSMTGFVLGFGLLYIQYHKSEISLAISALKTDIHFLREKLEQLINKS